MALGPRSTINPNEFYRDRLRFMENTILAFLQAIFSQMPKQGEATETVNGPDGPSLCWFHYDADNPDDSEISIMGQSTDNLVTVDERPRITVARGPVQFQQAGINASIGSANLSLAKQRHAIIMAGSVGISCYSREQLEADRIAELCASSIEAFQPIIRKYGFLEIRASQIGQCALIKSDARPELFVTPVLIRASVTSNWTRQKVDPVKLRKIVQEFIIEPVGLTVP